jgi:hypothetical protein
LANFPGITDDQLQSLLERVNARSVTTSIVLDKKPSVPITGAGLESLRHSQVLESIDLRQSLDRRLGPTGLNDDLVADILSTMIPHKLHKVKLRKQFESQGAPFDEYTFAWGTFMTTLKMNQARRSASESCSHCNISLVPAMRCLTLQVTQCIAPTQCTICKQYSCQPWNHHSSQCPSITECSRCLEWCCSCRQMVTCDDCTKTNCLECEQGQLTCESCGSSSCSECKGVLQCKTCHDTSCGNCRLQDMYVCSRCNEVHCEDCRYITFCHCCGQWVCEDCSRVTECDDCNREVCTECQKSPPVNLVQCQECYCALCDTCCNLETSFQECSYCGVDLCWDCMDEHDCLSPGQIVYNARPAADGDDKSSLCSCGKKHLRSPEGQQFMCAWRKKAKI